MTSTLHAGTKFQGEFGKIVCADSLEYLKEQSDNSVDLVVTSPPFGLVRKKDYGNKDADEYVEWFKPFGEQVFRVLKDTGSFVIDIGGAWKKGAPTRSLYHYKLLIALCDEVGFELAQEFFWWNPSRLPTPAEWVTVRRIRVKDAVNTVWWLSKTEWPKASNRRVLQPYSPSMKQLLKNGYTAKLRPSGHDISEKFSTDNGAAIPPNLLAIPNTESNSKYLRFCEENGFKPHPARFPADLPEYFVQMLTDKGDTVIDPFGGSCVTGEVCERLKRRWTCIELSEDYCRAALGRFDVGDEENLQRKVKNRNASAEDHYRISKPGLLWSEAEEEIPLPQDGGKSRPQKITSSTAGGTSNPRKRRAAKTKGVVKSVSDGNVIV